VIGRLPDRLGGGVEHIRIVRREHQRRSPVEPMIQLGGRMPGIVDRIWTDVLRLLSALVEAVELIFRIAVDDVGIARVGNDEA
jgi:hypothetical protein